MPPLAEPTVSGEMTPDNRSAADVSSTLVHRWAGSPAARPCAQVVEELSGQCVPPPHDVAGHVGTDVRAVERPEGVAPGEGLVSEYQKVYLASLPVPISRVRAS